MTISQKGIALIKNFEGFVDHIYTCPAGKLTIGYGHVVENPASFPSTISQKEADTLLMIDIAKFIRLVQAHVKVSLTQGQFDALVCFAFNTGRLGKTMLQKLNAKDYLGCSQEFLRWVYATVEGKKVKLFGLVKRREAEKALFLS